MLEGAIRDFERALELDPKPARIRVELGDAYVAAARYGDAIREYTNAIELDPSFVAAITRRGQAYERSERHQDALADYQWARELHPNDAEAWLRSGLLQVELGAPEEAAGELRTFLRLAPNHRMSKEAREALAQLPSGDITRIVAGLRPGDLVKVELRSDSTYRLYRFVSRRADRIELEPASSTDPPSFSGRILVPLDTVSSIESLQEKKPGFGRER
jgi:tetratricopeptide (TPR) repeat protein